MKVSIIICTKNSEKYIKDVIEAAKSINPFEIILVDAHSTDKTVKIAKKYKIPIVYDSGTGLGNARNIGLKKAKGNYVLYVGSDNILIKNFLPTNSLKIDEDYNIYLESLVNEMAINNWAGIGVRSFLFAQKKTYLSNGMAFRWVNKIKPGVSKVIGTPFMFKKETLLKYKFIGSFSDDTDLCDRMAKDGLIVGYTNRFMCFDIWQGAKSLIERFKMYGKSDREFFLQHYKKWGIMRRIKSLLHPMSEFRMIRQFKDIKYIPYVLFIVFWRYVGYANI
jgi:glycosyltransferase involved in cell wall biosynthesis